MRTRAPAQGRRKGPDMDVRPIQHDTGFRHMTGQTDLGKTAVQLAKEEEEKKKNGVEYDAFEAGGFAADWVANTFGELQGPIFEASKALFPADKYPMFQ